MAAKLLVVGSTLRTHDPRAVRPPPKTAAPLYQSPEFRDWRAKVIRRAGGRCEEIVAGVRCSKAQPEHRLFADHVVEVKDGGALFDVENGRCLCGSHHGAKTARSRADRRHA